MPIMYEVFETDGWHSPVHSLARRHRTEREGDGQPVRARKFDVPVLMPTDGTVRARPGRPFVGRVEQEQGAVPRPKREGVAAVALPPPAPVAFAFLSAEAQLPGVAQRQQRAVPSDEKGRRGRREISNETNVATVVRRRSRECVFHLTVCLANELAVVRINIVGVIAQHGPEPSLVIDFGDLLVVKQNGNVIEGMQHHRIVLAEAPSQVVVNRFGQDFHGGRHLSRRRMPSSKIASGVRNDTES